MKIGHESIHGFDDQGSQFDGHGNRVNWWTPQDKQRFDAPTADLARQYDGYAPISGKPGLKVNGKLTLGEDIADLVASTSPGPRCRRGSLTVVIATHSYFR